MLGEESSVLSQELSHWLPCQMCVSHTFHVLFKMGNFWIPTPKLLFADFIF